MDLNFYYLSNWCWCHRTSFTIVSALYDENFQNQFISIERTQSVIKPDALWHNTCISESAFALYDENRKENAQTMNHQLCHRFTLRINKQNFTSLGIKRQLVNNLRIFSTMEPILIVYGSGLVQVEFYQLTLFI